jgi:hypothetical protein
MNLDRLLRRRGFTGAYICMLFAAVAMIFKDHHQGADMVVVIKQTNYIPVSWNPWTSASVNFAEVSSP